MEISINEKSKFNTVIIDWFIVISVIWQAIFSIINAANPDYIWCECLFFNIYVLLVLLVLYTIINNLYEHFILFGFYVCFFVFLLGQKIFMYLDGQPYYATYTFVLTVLTPTKYLIFNNAIYLSLITSFVGYRWLIKKKPKDTCTTAIPLLNQIEKINAKNNQIVLKIMFIGTFICAFIMQLLIVIAKKDVSYVEGYTMNVDIPIILKVGNYLFLGFSLLLLSTKLSKQWTFITFVLFFIIQGGIQVFVGRRLMVAQTSIFILWYIITNYVDKTQKFKFRYLVYIGFFGVGLIVAFYFVELFREGSQDGNIFESIKDFFVSTGGSDSTIANIIDKGELFPKNPLRYVFDPVIDVFTNNKVFSLISSALFGAVDTTSSAQGLDYLNHSDNFSHWLSYITNSELYVAGYGMGSSYIAETLFAFGLIGVGIIGIVLGLIIAKLSKTNIKQPNIYLSAIAMFFIYNLFSFPRSGLLSWFSSFVYVIIAFIIFKMISLIISVKNYDLRS